MALLALLVPTGVYSVYSEHPIGQGYADVALFRRPPILAPKHQYLVEVKHLKKKDKRNLDSVTEEGRKQLSAYLEHPDVARHGDFLGWLIVVVGYEVVLLEEVRG